MAKPALNIGLIGTGFMGKAHAVAFVAAPRVFDLAAEPVLHTVADVTRDAAQRAADTYGFTRATGDWRRLVADPDIDIVSVTAPNALHKEMSLAAMITPLAPLTLPGSICARLGADQVLSTPTTNVRMARRWNCRRMSRALPDSQVFRKRFHPACGSARAHEGGSAW